MLQAQEPLFVVQLVHSTRNERDKIRVRARDPIRAHDLAHQWLGTGWRTSDITDNWQRWRRATQPSGERDNDMLYQPFERDRRYRFSVQVFDPENRYEGTDVFDGRVIDCYVALVETPGGERRMIPISHVFRADDKPCAHKQSVWDASVGYVCVDCGMEFLPNIWRARVAQDEGKYVVYSWDPRTRRWSFVRSYKGFKLANEYACYMTEKPIACLVQGDE